MWHNAFFKAVCLLVVSVCVGCASRPPIVSDPPQHSPAPGEQIPWEEQYSRAMIRPEAAQDSSLGEIHHDQPFNGTIQTENEDRTTLGVVADVIAFPFRAIGWLFQSVF